MNAVGSTPMSAIGGPFARLDQQAAASRTPGGGRASADRAGAAAPADELSGTEKQRVDELASRDREVRTHEQAHVAAAGTLFRGGPYYTYTRGPDGRQYATGGRVDIDTSEGRTPEESIEKAAKIRAAALAPAEPSSQDRAVAADAAQMEARARAELARERSEGEDDASGEDDRDEPPRSIDVYA